MLAVVTFSLALVLLAGISSQTQLAVPVVAAAMSTPWLLRRCRGGTKGESRVSQQRNRDKALQSIFSNKVFSIYTEDLE